MFECEEAWTSCGAAFCTGFETLTMVQRYLMIPGSTYEGLNDIRPKSLATDLANNFLTHCIIYIFDNSW